MRDDVLGSELREQRCIVCLLAIDDECVCDVLELAASKVAIDMPMVAAMTLVIRSIVEAVAPAVHGDVEPAVAIEVGKAHGAVRQVNDSLRGILEIPSATNLDTIFIIFCNIAVFIADVIVVF